MLSLFISQVLFPGFDPTACTGGARSNPKVGMIYFLFCHKS